MDKIQARPQAHAAPPLRSAVPSAPQDIAAVRDVGARPHVVQIAGPRHLYRPAYIFPESVGDHELVSQPLASPTGPGGAAGFQNRNGSQLASPQVTNVYLGPYWGDKAFLEGFSKAIVEFGYLQPLADLKYGTGPGKYLGPVEGQPLASGTTLTDAAAQALIARMLDTQQLTASADSLFVLILPTGVRSQLGTDASCSTYCGYHDAFAHGGIDVAYAVLPSPVGCAGCGNGAIGDFTAVYAHELAEAATDKIPGQGWTADDGQENGDLEAWILFGWGPPSDPHRYTVQGYYTNERGNTVGAWTGPA